MARGVPKLVSAYARGVVSRVEAINQLMQLAAVAPPAEIAADLPAEWLADLRRDCVAYFPCPPAGGMLFFSSVCNEPGYDADRARREFEDSWRAGLSAWQAFFGIGAGGRAEPSAAADRRGTSGFPES